MTKPESAAKWAINIANDQSHGYSQQNRWGPDFDCSALALEAYIQAGVPIDTSRVYHTGTMSGLKNYGFKDVASKVNFNTCAGMLLGDILVWHNGSVTSTDGHTAIYIGNGQIVHARGQSYGSPKTGDQGTEIAVTPYYRGKWQHVYRYVGGGSAPAVPQSAEMCSVSVSLPLIMYGSKGSAVRVWQAIVGVETDGEFGEQTKLATLGFQTNHGLTADSEVGKKTWTAGLSELTYT